MYLGMSLSTFTVLHVAISLAAIASGALVLRDMLRSRQAAGLTAVFLATTLATSVTGFCFPAPRLGVGHLIGALSLLVLAPTLMALYRYRLAGPWGRVYAAGATAALWLNVFIAVMQAYARSPTLRDAAPPYMVTQATILALFVWLGWRAVKRLQGGAPAAIVHIRLPPAPV